MSIRASKNGLILNPDMICAMLRLGPWLGKNLTLIYGIWTSVLMGPINFEHTNSLNPQRLEK